MISIYKRLLALLLICGFVLVAGCIGSSGDLQSSQIESEDESSEESSSYVSSTDSSTISESSSASSDDSDFSESSGASVSSSQASSNVSVSSSTSSYTSSVASSTSSSAASSTSSYVTSSSVTSSSNSSSASSSRATSSSVSSVLSSSVSSSSSSSVVSSGSGSAVSSETSSVISQPDPNMLTIYNDTVWRDTDGNEIKAQGGGIIKSGNTYHWFGPDFGEGSDYSFRAINHYTSTDLVNWTKNSPAAAKSDSVGVPSGWVGRPWVLYNEPTKKYVMILELGGGHLGVRNQFAFLTADSLYGPWHFEKNKSIQKMPDNAGTLYTLGDLGAFQDDDGNAYILYTFDKSRTNGAQGIYKLNPNNFTEIVPIEQGGLVAEFSDPYDMVREAAAIIKRGNTYYYFTSKCSGWNSSATKYRTASNINGPWSEAKEVATSPWSGTSFNTQHDFVLPVVGTKTTSYIYCGDRWSNYTGLGIGRNAWFPMTFDEKGVPTINGDLSWSVNAVTGEIEFEK